MTKLKEILEKQKFSANSKVAKALKSKTATDIELAIAAKTTKPYKEVKEVKDAVDLIIKNAETLKAEPVKEPVKKATGRGAEPRRY